MSIATEIRLRIRTENTATLGALSDKLNKISASATASTGKFRGLAAELRRSQTDSVKSTGLLKQYSAAWRELAGSVDFTSKEFREATAEVARLDAQIAKAEGRMGKSKAGGLRTGARIAGTAAAAGIFGGPEGALGALGGGILGGVEGAAVGAGVGALASQMRQSLSGFAEYTANINKQRIALRGLTTSNSEYEISLQTVERLSQQFQIPQEQVTRNFTKLAASVIGAGGNLKTAEAAFVGIASGVRGTGGSLQDLDGALLATAQTFSKGKVSAEELRGQIGERLPGAFTLFAKSIGKTGPELDKMLKDGEVGLNDFIAFVIKLKDTFGETNAAIVLSSAAAGDRLAVVFAKIQEQIGLALQPVGADFQNSLAKAITENKEELVAFATGLAAAAKAVLEFTVRFGPAIVQVASLITGIKLLQGAVFVIKGAMALFAAQTVVTGAAALTGRAGLMMLAGGFASTGAAATAAAAGVGLLRAAIAIIPGLGWIAATGVALIEVGKFAYNTDRTFRNFVDNIGGVVANDFKYAVEQMAADAKTSAGDIKTAYEDLAKQLDPIGQFIKELFSGVFKSTSKSAKTSATASSNAFNDFFVGLSSQASAGFNGLNRIIANWYSSLPAPIRSLFAGNVASMLIGAGQYAGGAASRAGRPKPERQGPYVPDRLKKKPEPDPLLRFIEEDDGDGDGKKGAKGQSAAQREKERVAEVIRSQGLLAEKAKSQLKFSEKIFAAEQARDPLLVRRLQGEKQLVEWGYETANLLEKEKSAEGRLAIARAQQAKQALIILKTDQDITKIQRKREETGRKTLEGLQNELKIKKAVTQAERDSFRIAYEMKLLEKGGTVPEGDLAGIQALKEQLAAPVLGDDLIRQQIGTLSDELLVLTDVGTQVTSVAATIGDAFSTSFKGVISGSMSAQEALAGFFRSVADHFLDMAAQIIAKMIQMAILNAIVGVLPGGGGAGSGTLALSSNPNVGAYMGGGGIEGITMGTFGGFKANGGPVSSGQTYMVGERGPELFVPGRSGSIVPNGAMGGDVNVVVNVDAKGSSVEGDQSQAKALGNAISAAVQSELVKQKRPGGLLA
jgi:tape measure domain-containing protein